MQKNSFFKNSIILTSSNLVTGIFKFMFSIILSYKLGPMGIGLYSLIMPIYDFFAVIVCGGMTTAISKECAYFYGKKDFKNLHKSVRVSLLFDLFWSIIMSISLFCLSPLICRYVICDNRALHSLWLICPAILFVALSAIFKGYFYGTSRVLTPAIIDILEKAVRMIVIVFVISIFNLREIEKTVSITYLALCLGEFASLILLSFYYKRSEKDLNISYSNTKSSAELLLNILCISIPLCINGILTTGLSTASTLLLPERLVLSGLTHSKSLALIGKFTGMATAITFFPLIAVNSISTILVPDISENLSKGNTQFLEKRFTQVIDISFILGMATLCICLVIPENLGQLFFKRMDLSPYIRFAALSCPFLYVSSTTFGILNGLGKQKTVLKNSVLSAIIELFLIYKLSAISFINIYGYGISLIVTSIITLILNILEIKKEYNFKISFIKIIIYVFLGLALCLALSILNYKLMAIKPMVKNLFLILFGFSAYILGSVIIYSFLNKKTN